MGDTYAGPERRQVDAPFDHPDRRMAHPPASEVILSGVREIGVFRVTGAIIVFCLTLVSGTVGLTRIPDEIRDDVRVARDSVQQVTSTVQLQAVALRDMQRQIEVNSQLREDMDEALQILDRLLCRIDGESPSTCEREALERARERNR